MLTSRKRRGQQPQKMIEIRCPEGMLIPRPASGMRMDKWARFYNWPRTANGSPLPDEKGGPKGAEMVVTVPDDSYHRRMIMRGTVSLVETTEPKPAPAPPKRKVVSDD